MKNLEIIFAGIGTFLILLATYFISIYEDFFLFQELIATLIPTLIGIISSIIGVILTGLALLISFFNKETKERFGIENINMTLGWFIKISKISGIYIISLVILYIFLISQRYYLLPITLFYVVLGLYIFIFLYIIFYIIAIIQNIVRLFRTNNNLELSEQIKYDLKIEALFIQQEIILKNLITNNLLDLDSFSYELQEIVKNEKDKKKREQLLNYFSKYYDVKF